MLSTKLPVMNMLLPHLGKTEIFDFEGAAQHVYTRKVIRYEYQRAVNGTLPDQSEVVKAFTP